MQYKDIVITDHEYVGKKVILPESGRFYYAYHGLFSDLPRTGYLDGSQQTKGIVAKVLDVSIHVGGTTLLARVELPDGKRSFVDVADLKLK